jgi:hypothetical protein
MTHKLWVNTVSLQPDGQWVASAGCDERGDVSCDAGSVRVWLWRPEDLITEACARLPRKPHPRKWEHYMGDEPYRATCPSLPIPDLPIPEE